MNNESIMNDESMSREPKERSDCLDARAALEEALLDGRLDGILLDSEADSQIAGSQIAGSQIAGSRKTGSPERSPDALLRHMQECLACRETASTVGEVDHALRDHFRDWNLQIPSPSEDTIAQMLRRVEAPSKSGLLRRIRRTLSPTLWVVFFLFTLLAGCTLIALALRALKG